MKKQETACSLGDPMLMMVVKYCMAKSTDFEFFGKNWRWGMGEAYKAWLENNTGISILSLPEKDISKIS